MNYSREATNQAFVFILFVCFSFYFWSGTVNKTIWISALPLLFDQVSLFRITFSFSCFPTKYSKSAVEANCQPCLNTIVHLEDLHTDSEKEEECWLHSVGNKMACSWSWNLSKDLRDRQTESQTNNQPTAFPRIAGGDGLRFFFIN